MISKALRANICRSLLLGAYGVRAKEIIGYYRVYTVCICMPYIYCEYCNKRNAGCLQAIWFVHYINGFCITHSNEFKLKQVQIYSSERYIERREKANTHLTTTTICPGRIYSLYPFIAWTLLAVIPFNFCFISFAFDFTAHNYHMLSPHPIC